LLWTVAAGLRGGMTLIADLTMPASANSGVSAPPSARLVSR
jgi:hypothetical protein